MYISPRGSSIYEAHVLALLAKASHGTFDCLLADLQFMRSFPGIHACWQRHPGVRTDMRSDSFKISKWGCGGVSKFCLIYYSISSSLRRWSLEGCVESSLRWLRKILISQEFSLPFRLCRRLRLRRGSRLAAGRHDVCFGRDGSLRKGLFYGETVLVEKTEARGSKVGVDTGLESPSNLTILLPKQQLV